MKILIVNCFKDNKENQEYVKQFQSLVQNIFKEDSQLVDTEIEFFFKDIKNLEDVLYEINSEFMKKESAKNFDIMDIIFIAGEAVIKPWSSYSRKLMLLLLMCIRTQKVVFATGLGMTTLVYLSATDFERFHRIDRLGSDEQVKKPEFYINPVSGDLITKSNDGMIKVHGNVGMHSRHSAQEFQMLGKYIMQVPRYHPPKVKELYEVYFNNENETICYIKKTSIQHWCFQNVPIEFKCEAENKWDIHQFAFINSKKKFNVLADGQKGPLIIEIQNSLATIFLVKKKYPSTVTILKNFIKKYCELYKQQNIKYTRIDLFKLLPKFEQEEEKQFIHSGYAQQHKFQQLLVRNNAIDVCMVKRNPYFQKTKKKQKDSQNSIHSQEIFSKPDFSIYPQGNESSNTLDKPEFVYLKGARSIRKFLHPTLKDFGYSEFKDQVTGMLSQRINNNPSEKSQLKLESMKFNKIQYPPYESVFITSDRKRTNSSIKSSSTLKKNINISIQTRARITFSSHSPQKIK